MKEQPQRLSKVYSKNGKEVGIASSGSGYRCTMEGCTGQRLYVRWPDGKVTRPCTKGLIPASNGSWRVR